MPCIPVNDGLGGGTMIVCTRRKGPPPCVVCGRRSSKLCDGPGARPDKTCDAALCSACAVGDGERPVFGREPVDYCPPCAELVK